MLPEQTKRTRFTVWIIREGGRIFGDGRLYPYMSGKIDTHRVAALASRQHGNITLAQLHEIGFDEDAVEHRVAIGWLLPRHRRVFAVGHVPRSRESRWFAAALALGPRAVVSHISAAILWGIMRRAAQAHVTVPTRNGLPRRDGIVVHRQVLHEEHRSTRAGIPCTNLVRTMLDLAAILPLKATAAAFEEAQVIAKLRPEVLAAEVLSRPGFRGNGKLRTILTDAVDPAGVRSILELRFLRLCAAQGIPRPLVNEKIDVWTPDFLWPEAMLAVETDGVDFHRTAAKRRRDEKKDAYLRAQGFTVVRLTWADVVNRPEPTAAGVRDALTVEFSPICPE
jgi:hypothetical protein